ncbi:3' terminal RNA ribose 2'-O-methyltransferase Hen1 [Candidatus Uabimicrobium sp. HlEnr_7]|uniref:3' terminal RNA ribose 2'-O-methyltransferase Hen1 n=1 Tax=Candidatus Uabimicrobium helgolandensis TaxID=3095367 RepID=UPI0035567EB3
MLLTLSTTRPLATDIGYLLHKHPDKFQTFDFPYGKIHVFYPEATKEKCTIALLLDINPIELIRTKKSSPQFALKQYVNDRPYVASSFMSVAISKVLSSAMNGRCDAKPELVNEKIPLSVTIPVLPARGASDLIEQIFAPLGYKIKTQRHALDEKFPEWGDSDYYTATLEATTTLQLLLTHLYVLIPVLDNEKHYWVDQSEIKKLLRKGGTWLEKHPARELILNRYLKYQKSLYSKAMQILTEEGVSYKQKPDTLHTLRLQQVLQESQKTNASSVVDLGCGEGRMLELLLQEKQFTDILGMDASSRVLGIVEKRLYFDDMAPKQRERINLIQGALTYNDNRIYGYDLALLIEVIEHLDEERLQTLERILFEFAQPKVIIITTPNKEYNNMYENLQDGFRHNDHRFEWTRQQFQDWCDKISAKYNYAVRHKTVGEEHPQFGSPGQMGVFTFKWK